MSSNAKPAGARPTPRQLEWADAEVGVIIHLDVQVFEPTYRFREMRGYTPAPTVFAPPELDTDQWLDTARRAGAKYAVLVAKHCSGFSLWPTRAHDYSVAASPWRGGRGDVVGDFFKSCAKFGIKPGLYCSAACNAYLNVDNPGRVLSGDSAEQQRYNAVVEQQLTELWGDYGELFEIWFDGGVIPPAQGGPEIVPILERLQPGAVVFQGPANWRGLLRWVGNERGEAPYPCWSATDRLTAEDGTTEKLGMGGNPLGSVWAPGESDMPNRDQHRAFQGGWFWRAGEDHLLYSLDHLVERYYCSVGRNTNLLLGMVIDNRGLVPEADRARFAEFGTAIAARFGRPRARTAGSGQALELSLPAGGPVSQAVLAEDLAQGERVRQYRLEALCGGEWRPLAEGSCIGHKRIECFPALAAEKFRLTVTEAADVPQIREFALFE